MNYPKWRVVCCDGGCGNNCMPLPACNAHMISLRFVPIWNTMIYATCSFWGGSINEILKYYLARCVCVCLSEVLGYALSCSQTSYIEEIQPFCLINWWGNNREGGEAVKRFKETLKCVHMIYNKNNVCVIIHIYMMFIFMCVYLNDLHF
jgi:hypothetical protein